MAQVSHQTSSFPRGRYQCVEVTTVQFSDCFGRFNETRFLQVEQKTFILRQYCFVTPMTRIRIATDIASERSQRIAMMAIAGNDFGDRVATSEEDCEHEGDNQAETRRCPESFRESARCPNPTNLRCE